MLPSRIEPPDVSACEMEAIAMSYKNDNVSVLLDFASKARNIQFCYGNLEIAECVHLLNISWYMYCMY